MSIDFLLDVFSRHKRDTAIIWKDAEYSYSDLLQRVRQYISILKDKGITPGKTVALYADFSPDSIAMMLALIELGNIVVPVTNSVNSSLSEYYEVAEVQYQISFSDKAQIGIDIQSYDRTIKHPLLLELIEASQPGLILFSSGSTGKSKAALHNMNPILDKFKVARKQYRAITFLLFDHIGGINTMLYQLSNGGCIVAIEERTPHAVLSAIERHRVQLLPTSPTFLNMILVSEAYTEYDLSSLEIITYGTEPMPEGTLMRLNKLFPNINLVQTYGLSELGIMRSKSKSSDSLWVKVGGEGFQTRIVGGILQIKAQSAMLGYLNAESPFTDDGWFNTGDMVEQDGDYIRIMGRVSEVINVGGQKVYPAEVEGVLLQMDNIEDVTVKGEKHPLMGQVVSASVVLKKHEEIISLRSRMRSFCHGKLEPYKIPVIIKMTESVAVNPRFKKQRRTS